MIMYIDTNPVIHKFSGLISFKNEKFFDINFSNFCMRGSVLRNTPFVIGVVIYVGNQTKAHQNAKMRSRKQSWLINEMHSYIVQMFFALGIIVMLLTFGGLTW